MQCTAVARRTDERCQNEALEDAGLCGMHDAVPEDSDEILRLKKEAARVSHVTISLGQYRKLLNDSERLKQKEAKERRGRPVGCGTQ